MITNKNQFKNALKTNKDNIKIKRVYNFDKDNKIIYYQYIPEDKEEIAFENAKKLGIDVIKLDSKEYEKMNKDNNYNYNYKYIYMINEIIEN